MRVVWLVAALLLSCAFVLSGAHAIARESSEGAAANPTAVKRTVLALYDGREKPAPSQTHIHELAEMPLNYLGYKVAYWDLQHGFPDIGGRPDIAGVLVWFERPPDRSIAFLEWLLAVSESGTKIILIGDIEAENNWANRTLADIVFGRLGLSYSGDSVEATYRTEIVKLDPNIYAFERSLTAPLPPFPIVKPISSDVEAHVVLSVPFSPDEISTVVATGPHGGYAASNYVIYDEPLTKRIKWLLNPFVFFEKALGAPHFPIPDVTTLSGRRIYISHIDGDGWNNVSEIENYRQDQTTSAEVVLKELIQPYPDLPVTVGVIGADTNPELGGTAEAANIARRLFALRQVEVASHTYTHPFHWSFFEDYDRDAELALIEREYVDDRDPLTRYIDKMTAARNGHSHGRDRYVSGSDILPRVYMKNPFDLDLEIKGALDTADSLSPPGKRAMAYLWSGDTMPFETALRAVREAGVKNINGGDSRFDMEWPSVAYVPPISRVVGNERQIYAVNSNENTYTNDWTGPYFGQALLPETLKNTDAPRRLKGIDVYYHMYTGERPASLAAVRDALEDARKGRVTPIATSHYAAIAEGFFDTEIVETGSLSWRIRNRGALNTVRFDHPGRYRVDLAASRGVTGYTHYNDSLYVSLDPSVAVIDLSLAPKMPETAQSGSTPRLVESRWAFSNLLRTSCGINADVTGFGNGTMVLAELKPGRTYGLTLARGREAVWRGEARAAEDGRLAVTMPADARETLRLRMYCA